MSNDAKTEELIRLVKTLLIVQLLDMGVTQGNVREIAKVSMNTVSEIAQKLPQD
jgi:hypothetical protein